MQIPAPMVKSSSKDLPIANVLKIWHGLLMVMEAQYNS